MLIMMRFSPSECKILLQDWFASLPELVIKNEVNECVDRITCLESLISTDDLVSDEIWAQIQKTCKLASLEPWPR